LIVKLDEHIESLQKKVGALRKAADLMEIQFPYRNPIWIKSMDKKPALNDIMAMVGDLEHEARGGRDRQTTWAKGKGKNERRRVGNTMGYVSHCET
jgi:hypothetical protein